MGLHILAGKRINDNDQDGAVLYCSTSMTVLPILFDSAQQAQDFIDRYGDVRIMTDQELTVAYAGFRRNPTGSSA